MDCPSTHLRRAWVPCGLREVVLGCVCARKLAASVTVPVFARVAPALQPFEGRGRALGRGRAGPGRKKRRRGGTCMRGAGSALQKTTGPLPNRPRFQASPLTGGEKHRFGSVRQGRDAAGGVGPRRPEAPTVSEPLAGGQPPLRALRAFTRLRTAGRRSRRRHRPRQ